MEEKEDLKLLYTGSDINAKVLQEVLLDNQIPSFLRNDANSAKAAGFGVTYEDNTNVFVTEENFEKAKELLAEFLKSFDK